MTGWWRRARIMSAVGAGTLVLGAGSVVHAAGVGDAVPPDVPRADGMAGFRLWLSGPGSDARLTVLATGGTEIRPIGCFAPGDGSVAGGRASAGWVSGERASAGRVPEGRFPEGRPSAGRRPEEGLSGERFFERGLSGGWRECLVGEVGARTVVDVLFSAPMARGGVVGLVATLRMRTPEGEWVTRTASGLGAVRPAGGELGEADVLARRDSVGVEIEPITWEEAGAPVSGSSVGAGAPGSVGGLGTRDASGPFGGVGVSGSREVPGAQGVPGVGSASGSRGAPEGLNGAGVSGEVGASGGPKASSVPSVSGDASTAGGSEAVGASGGSKASGALGTAGGSEAAGASGSSKVSGVPGAVGASGELKASGGGDTSGFPGASDASEVPGEAKAGALPYRNGKGRRVGSSGPLVSAGVAGQMPPVWNDPNLRMPLAAAAPVVPVSPAIAAEVPPPGAPLPQDVDGPGQEIEPVALWTPSLTGASGFPVVGGSVGGLLGLLWLQARIQRRRRTR